MITLDFTKSGKIGTVVRLVGKARKLAALAKDNRRLVSQAMAIIRGDK